MLNYVNNSIVLLVAIVSLAYLFSPKIGRTKTWHAIVTPLASIIGSGFLVAAPLLFTTSGKYAVFVMLAIVSIAYALGSSIRFNILYVEPQEECDLLPQFESKLESFSRLLLGAAYVISVTFYLKLLASFVLHGFGVSDLIYKNIFTTMLLLIIGLSGKWRGLSVLESLEVFSVNTKLSIIVALLIASLAFNVEKVGSGEWQILLNHHDSYWQSFRQILGTLIIIQGFETSRYMGYAYSKEMRVNTMRYAQIIASIIYVIFIALMMVVFKPTGDISETLIIEMSKTIATFLPVLLITAAVMSQFSAAIADTIGGAGLIVEETHKRISVNNCYLLIMFFAIILTWATNIYEIIVFASKAFALYYALQLLITILTIKKIAHCPYRYLKSIGYFALLLLMLLVVSVGLPVE